MNEYDNNYSTNGNPAEASAHYGASAPGGYGTPAPAPRRREKRGFSVGAVVALCLLCSLLAAALGVGGTWFVLRSGVLDDAPPAAEATPAPLPETTDEALPPQTEAGSDAASLAAAAGVGEHIYDQARRQVVGVTTEIIYANIFGQVSPASVSGTGFIISDDGYIMTNNHVIEEARKGGYEVSVLTFDGTEYTAQIVGYDEDNDIAVLKIDAAGLTPVTYGGPEDIVVGREIYPVGNPLGELNFTMTTGIISATDRLITTDSDSDPINMFQIDAAVNSGNSGGPVYDTNGDVIGVVTAKQKATGVEGLGFAIPISDAAHIADQIIQYGYVKDRATLGIEGSSVTSAMAERYGMVVGAYVSQVDEGSPAEAAGIQVRDIITALNGEAVTGYSALTTAIHSYAVGDTVEVTVWRAGEKLTLSATLGESRPPVEATPAPEQYQYGYGAMDDFFRQFFGGFGF